MIVIMFEYCMFHMLVNLSALSLLRTLTCLFGSLLHFLLTPLVVVCSPVAGAASLHLELLHLPPGHRLLLGGSPAAGREREK
jgi:hypothetical protein